MIITVSSFTVQPSTSLTGSTCVLRLWYNQSYLDSTGQFVQGGTATTGHQYRITCTIAAGIITVPPFSIYSTLDAQSPNPQSINISGNFFKGNTNTGITPFNQSGCPSMWIVPDDLGASISFAEWTIANQRIVLANAPSTYYTASQVDALINASQYAPATTTSLGLVRVDATPTDPLIPVSVSITSPKVSGFTVHTSKYATFNLAVAAVVALGGGTVVIDADSTVSANISVPVTVRVVGTGHGQLSGAFTVTFLGPFESPARRVFASGLTASFDGNNIIGVLNAAWWGATGDDSTDNTAIIQTVITAAVNKAMSASTASTIVIEFEPGVYVVSGALVQNSIYNAQITIPVVGTSEVGPRPQLILRSSAFGSPPQPYGTSKGGANVLFRSTLTGQSYSGTYGLPCIMGGPDPIHGTVYSLHTYLGVHLQGVGFKAPSNPTICGFNGSMLDSMIVEDMLCTTTDLNVGYGTAVQPTAPTGIAVLMPLNNFNGSEYRGLNIVTGWYGAFGISELTTVSGNLYSVQNRVAFNLQTPWYHIADIGSGWCYSVRDNYGLAQIDPSSGLVNPTGIGPNNVTLIRGSVSFEDAASGWMVRTNHINDPNNKLIGYLDYIRVTTGVGADGAGLTKSGGTLVTTRNIQNPWLFAWGTDNLQVRGGTGNNSTGSGAYATSEVRSDQALGEFNAYSSTFATASVRQKVGLFSQASSLGLLVGTNTAHGLDFVTSGINLRGGYAADGAFKFYGMSAPAISGAGNAHTYSTTGGKLQLSQNGGAYLQVPTTLSATASLDYTQALANTCEVLSMTVTGAVDGDVVEIGVPTALANHNTTSTFFAWVSAADTVFVRRCVISADGSNPAAATVRATIIRH